MSRTTKEYREKIEKLEKENEALAKTLGKTTVERDWAGLKSLLQRDGESATEVAAPKMRISLFD